MDWTKQTEAMINAWTGAQKMTLEAWQNMFATSATGASSPDAFKQFYDQWREVVLSNLKGWAGDDPIARQVAEQLFASQSVMLRWLDMFMRAWQTVSFDIEAGQDWPVAIREYIEGLREQFSQSSAGIGRATEDIGELWSLYLDEAHRLGQIWQGAFQTIPGLDADSGWGTEIAELTNNYWDAFERTFGGLLDAPSLGMTRELNEKIAQGFERWLDLRRANATYQEKLGQVWADSFEQLLHEMATLAENEEPVDSVRTLLKLWGRVADQAFIDMFQTDDYVQIQGQLLNATMAYRIQQRELVDVYLTAMDLPTRAEVDEVHHNIYALRKEVKALKKLVTELKTDTQAVQTSPVTNKSTPPDADGEVG